MNTFKKITLTSAVAFALFTFNACGDDSNSTSASAENGSLSSAVEDDEASSSINDDSSSSVIPGSSSSVILSDSEGSSSSVKGSAPADVSSSSVIPDPDRESSSSSEKSSSSSAKSSSSVNSSSSNKQSSSSVKSSSSSVKQSSSSVASSSSEYVPFDHSRAFDGTLWRKGAYKTFVDKRNNREYYYLQIDGKKCLEYRENTSNGCNSTKDTSFFVMAENLNVGEMVRGFKDQKDDSKIERYCYDNDTTNCDRYGGLYQWAEMMQLPSECNTKSCADQIEPNHQGICPDGWHLLTHDDFFTIVNSNGNQDGVIGVRSTFGFGGSNDTGFSLVGAGMRITPMGGGGFKELNQTAYWFYPTENSYKDYATADNGSMGKNEKYMNKNALYKETGVSVRCVMNE